MAQKLPNVFSIGRLVERYGVSPESIRNWERQGLIPQTRRTPGGHRRYNRDHVEALDALFGIKIRPEVPAEVDMRRDERSSIRRPAVESLSLVRH